MSIGPKITVRRSCADCEACQGERYTCQSDSGTDVYCAHPSLPVRRIIGDSRWDTPQWCPAEPEIAARADARIAELETAIKRQAAAVKMIDMSHVARAETMMQHAQVLHDQSNTAALESERAANALLTERIAELEQDVTVRDTEIARMETDLELARREVKSLEEHLHALVEVSEDSTIARARAVMNGDDIGEDADEDADEDESRAGNGGGV